MFHNEISDVVTGMDAAQLKKLAQFAVNAVYNIEHYRREFVTLAITDGIISHDKVEAVLNPKTIENHQLMYLKQPVDVKEHHEHVKAAEKGRCRHA